MTGLVTLDALGTLVELEDPFGRLAERLAIPYDVARAALRAEMAHYRAHHDIASDQDGLARLRADCAEVLRAALPSPAAQLPHDDLLAALLGSLRFRPFPEVPGALRAMRAAGNRLVVVSNWDVSLHEVLDTTGLRPLVDDVLTSAEVGEAKPGGAMFALALEGTGVRAADAVHIGDSPEHDAAGALAAGLLPVLLDRDGTAGPVAPGVVVARDLAAAPYPGGPKR